VLHLSPCPPLLPYPHNHVKALALLQLRPGEQQRSCVQAASWPHRLSPPHRSPTGRSAGTPGPHSGAAAGCPSGRARCWSLLGTATSPAPAECGCGDCSDCGAWPVTSPSPAAVGCAAGPDMSVGQGLPVRLSGGADEEARVAVEPGATGPVGGGRFLLPARRIAGAAPPGTLLLCAWQRQLLASCLVQAVPGAQHRPWLL
jgi:hypothetical protein